jgi:WD40 repeat protein
VPISEICGYLRSVADELNSTLVIICDQFEEFFVNFKTKSEREPFLSFVAGCTNTADLPVKFLFSIRSDFLYLISAAFDDQISEPLLSTKRYHLRTFDEEQAEAIIEKSVERANVPFEPGLSCQVARDLAVNDRVLPSELQIVGEQLQQKRIFTLKEYRRAGGKEPLVYSFLEEVIQASGDQEAAKLLLRSLISEENTRLTLTLDEIAHRTERSRKSVVQILNLFVESRLIREIQEDEPWRYELTHEYLIEKVNQITGRVMDATQRANRMFRQYMSSYVADQRTRIPISKLWFIRRYSDVERGERERELLRKSLRWGLLKASALVVVVAMVTTLVAAVLSVNEEWEEVRLKDGHTAAAMRAIFSPDGRLLVSCGEDGKVIVWDFMRRERLQTFTDHTGWVRAVAFSPDGKWFATSGGDEKVIVWDAARLEKAAVLTGHKGRVMGIAFSPDGRMLATGSGAPPPGQLILWEAGRWEKVRELDRGLGYGNILFTPDSRYLLNPHGAICDLSLSQCVSGDVPWLGANWIALSPNASRLVGVHPGGEVMFSALERSGNSLVRKFLRSIPAHRFHGRSVAFSPDGRWLASAADDIVLWDAATQTKLAHLPYTAESWSVAFSPDGQWLVSSHSDGAVLLWSVTERELVANFNEHSNSVRAVAFSRDGKKIASASEDRSIIIWNAEDGRKETVLSGHDTRVTSVGFSPDGKSLASCDQQSTLIFWDLTERRPRWTFKHPRREPSYSVVISPDGRWIATSRGVFTSAGGEQVVDTQELVDRQIQEGHIYGLDFSADGKRLACVTDGGQLHLWDVETWRLLKAQKLTPLGLITVSFSPDGKRLVTGEDEGAIRLWDVESLKQIALIGRHSARIKKVAFSLDGRQVASAGEDQTIALWDVESRTLVTRIGTHTSPVLSLAWSPDGKRLASGEHDKSVRLYTRHRTLWGRRLD